MQAPVSLSRIIIFGHQLAILKAFYMEHFQFQVVVDYPDHWIVLNAGAVEIALHKIGPEFAPEEGQAFRAESNTKIVFNITTPITDFRQNLIDRGVNMGKIKSFPGMSTQFCDGEDPEGNMFQLQQ